MKRLAFYTIAILREPPDHPASKGFVDGIPDTFSAAERCVGFLDRQQAIGDWGPVLFPSVLSGDVGSRFAQTFSIWRDLEAVYAYAYNGRHAEGLKRRRDWFLEEAHPGYVAWWVAEDHRPNIAEAVTRIEKLHNEGPGAEAFNFTHPFDQSGRHARLSRDGVRTNVAQNKAMAGRHST